MAEHESYRSKSRNDWHPTFGEYTTENLQLGALQRIADACELIARSYTGMLNEIENQKRRADRLDERVKQLKRQLNSQKAATSRVRNRVQSGGESK